MVNLDSLPNKDKKIKDNNFIDSSKISKLNNELINSGLSCNSSGKSINNDNDEFGKEKKIIQT